MIKKIKERDKKSTTFAIPKFEEQKIYGEQENILIILNCICGNIICTKYDNIVPAQALACDRH